MVPGKGRFHNLRLAIGIKAGEEQRGLYLGAGNGRCVSKAAQILPLNRQRRLGTATATKNTATHAAQRFDHPAHWAGPQILVPGQY